MSLRPADPLDGPRAPVGGARAGGIATTRSAGTWPAASQTRRGLAPVYDKY